MSTHDRSHTITIELRKPAGHVFACILDVSKWWGGKDLTGSATRPGDEFVIRHGDVHYSKQRVVEIVDERKVVWSITESRLAWLESDKSEWTGTRLVFDLAARGDGTSLRFTHEGLGPEKECYEACSEGWNTVIKEYLFHFVTEGRVSHRLYE